MTETDLRGLDLHRRLESLWTGLVDGPSTIAVLGAAGVHDVGELLRRPAEELLALPGIGERKLARLVDAARHQALLQAGDTDPLAAWLPDVVLDHPFENLKLPRATKDALREFGVGCLRDVSRAEHGDPLEPHRPAVREALAREFAPALERTEPISFLAELRRFRTSLEPEDAALFDRLLGVGHRPCSIMAAATALRAPLDELRSREARLRLALSDSHSVILDRLGRDAESALTVRDGVVGVEELVVGTSLHTASQACSDPTLPLRWLAFARADRWSFEAERLCCLPSDELRRVVRTTQRELRRAVRPPILVADLVAAARCTVAACTPSMVQHVLRRVLGYALALDQDVGEIVTLRNTSLSDRLEALLEDADRPLPVDDLLFRYRDRFGRGAVQRIRDALRCRPAFLEVAPRTWSLRNRHVDELELLRPEAERLVDELRKHGGRIQLGERVRHGEISERCAHLLAAMLNDVQSLRPLGRGEFVLRRSGPSARTEALVEELRRAMGEVPFARFLQNCTPADRPLVSRLLRTNRLFVSPAKDRIDLAENYPLSGERLRPLLHTVRTCVEESGGYAHLARIQGEIAAAELGGSFLTDHLLLDVLRRHGEFEVLSGTVVAEPELQLGPFLQRLARDILRSRVAGLTFQQIVAERPDLAEFSTCLQGLLDADPLVQSEDGLHYQLA
jgi:hypothetical protein